MGTTQRFRSTAVEQAEAVLVEQYPQLVRLAYVTLPVSLGRHTRVLLAHKAVQRALPRGGRGSTGAPAGPDSPGSPLAEVRVRVLRASLAPTGRARVTAAALGWPPVPPFVWGLRLWPPAGGIDEAARLLGQAPGPVRAAFVLHRIDGLPEETAVRLLGTAGVTDPADAMREALAVRAEVPPAGAGPEAGTAPGGGRIGAEPDAGSGAGAGAGVGTGGWTSERAAGWSGGPSGGRSAGLPAHRDAARPGGGTGEPAGGLDADRPGERSGGRGDGGSGGRGDGRSDGRSRGWSGAPAAGGSGARAVDGADAPAADGPGGRSGEESGAGSEGWAVERAAGRTGDRPGGQPAGSAGADPGRWAAGRTADRSGDRSGGRAGDRTGGQAAGWTGGQAAGWTGGGAAGWTGSQAAGWAGGPGPQGTGTGGVLGETLLRAPRSPEFDASVVSARPTDLLRRRRRTRAAQAAVAALVLAAGILAADGSPPRPEATPLAGPAVAGALDPARLVRVPAGAWADTARVDFTAWPTRGGRTADRPLLARALAAWAARPREVAVTAAPGTATDLPGRAPQLLYAGDTAGRAVVLLLDADRVVRYAEAADGPRGRELAFARTDGADVTTAAALVLGRSGGDGGRARYLLAPWIAKAATRDLLRAGDEAGPLAVSAEGVTEETAVPRTGGACDSWPALELTSSARIVEKHSFVLADAGAALTPVHLTYTPLPDGPAAVAARQPREATGPAARAAWAAVACRLRELRGAAVRAVNIWDFADSELPDGAGRAVWSCTRASGWAGPGDVLVQLRPPAGPPQDVARARSTAACGRFGQHLLAGTRWRSPAGRWYLLAAGSREVTGITAEGAVRAEASGRFLTVPLAGPQSAPVALAGSLASGARITAIDGGAGGRD
ncbi:hypothetical protein [Streptomyces sp. NBC_00454]|uniref:hypothetical protein n=1 Tax=Streptomyces sp. NBC_00454 TaxID=2975747 RepID=UPI0030E29499